MMLNLTHQSIHKPLFCHQGSLQKISDHKYRVQFKVEKYVCFKSFVNEFFTSDYWNKNYVRILHKMRFVRLFVRSFVWACEYMSMYTWKFDLTNYFFIFH